MSDETQARNVKDTIGSSPPVQNEPASTAITPFTLAVPDTQLK